MKFPIYCVRDSLIGFGIPVIRDNDAVASRAFDYDCHIDGSMYAASPEHYQLFRIGEFDTDTAVLVPETPTLVASAIDFVGKES